MYKDMAINQKLSVNFPMGNQTSKLVPFSAVTEIG